MDSIAVIAALRYYWSNDSTLQTLLGVSTQAEALKRIVMKDAQYVNMKSDTADQYPLPAITLKLDDEEETVGVPSNEEYIEAIIYNSTYNANCIYDNIRIKDRLKTITAEKKSGDDFHSNINAQGQALALDPKVRGVFWVSASTYDDKEQGTQRLHRIICVLRMIVGD